MEYQRARSGSNSSSQELSADNVQIQVIINSEKTIKLNVRPSHTVSNVLEFLSASITLPAEVHLLQDGTQLQLSTTVSELNLTASSTLTLDPPTTSPSPSLAPAPAQTVATDSAPSARTATPSSTVTRTPKKSNRPRCGKEGCKTHAQPIVGDCGFCQKRFCGKHRMLESHNCSGLDSARQADKDRNAAKLEGERTVMLRGL